MLVKAGIAACVVACVAVTLSSIDFRQLYNEMYPVNGLRRDVLTLCHEVKPTFVRAIEADRIGCYDSMPDPVELAIGWVRTSSRLAAMHKPSQMEIAERLLVAAIRERRFDRLGPPHFTGYAMVTGGAAYACDPGQTPIQVTAKADPVLALPDDGLIVRLARGDRTALAALGLTSADRTAAARRPALPVLSLGGAGSSQNAEASDAVAGVADDAAPAVGLGDDSASVQASPAGPAICRTPT